MFQKKIISTQNTLIKELLLIKEKSRIRRKKNLFLIEGIREISLAIKGNYKINQLFINYDIVERNQLEQLLKNIDKQTEIIEISQVVYKKLSYRDSTEGILALANTKDHHFESLKFEHSNPLILVAEAPEKPGNIGALLRTADAANVSAVFIANPKTDLYNPNIIRSSVGCLFTVPVYTGTSSEIIKFLKANQIDIYGAALTASVDYTNINYNKASAIVVGTEATGLTQEWIENSTQNIIIPMRGEIDSMNVSVSAAIIIFEAVRQRNKI
ncbi:MAG: TrmH family RNA methyltransferase [Lutibacter sp.]